MSESADPSPTPSDSSEPKPDAAASSPEKPTDQPKSKKPGRWRRRFWTMFITVLSLGVIFRIGLPLLLPYTVKWVANLYGLDVTFDRADLNLTGGDTGLWHLRVTQLDSGAPVASADYARADLSTLQLLRGRLVVQRLEADGWELTLHRAADGTIPLLKKLMAGPAQPATAAKPKADEKPSPIDFTPPVAIDALRLTHVQLHVIDDSVLPKLDTTIEVNLRFSDLASKERPAKLTASLSPNAMWDAVKFEATGTSNATTINADWNFLARGLRPAVLNGYLEPLGITASKAQLAVGATGSIGASVIAGAGDSMSGSVHVKDVSLAADGQDVASISNVDIELASVSGKAADIKQIVLEKGAVVARRTSQGALRFAGLELGAAPASGAATKSAPVPKADSPTPQSAPQQLNFAVKLQELAVRKMTARFRDDAVEPAAELAFDVDDLSLSGVELDPKNPDTAAAFKGRFRAPGLTGPIAIDGTVKPFALKKIVEATVTAEEVRPDAIRSYLDIAGVQADLKSGKFTCEAVADVTLGDAGALSANARLTGVTFSDDKELLALSEVKATGVSLSPGAIVVEAIDVDGPHLAARREKGGAFWAAGFRLLPKGSVITKHTTPTPAVAAIPTAPATLPTAPSTQPADSSVRLAALPRLEVRRFKWNGVKLQLDDQESGSEGDTSLAIDDAGVEVTGLRIDLETKSPSPDPGKIHAWIKAPGLAGTLDLTGTVWQLASGVRVDLHVAGDHLSAKLAAPYLKALNIEPTLAQGALMADAHIKVTTEADTIHADVAAENVKLLDADEELLGIDKAAIAGVNVKAGDDKTPLSISVDSVALDKPRARAILEPGGIVRAAGIRLLPAPPAPMKSNFAAAASTAVVASAPPATAPAVPTTAPVPASPIISLRSLTIAGAALGLTDRTLEKPVDLAATVDGSIDNVIWGKPAEPIKLNFALKADGVVDSVKVDGTASATPDSGNVSLKITGANLRQGALAAYLPAGVNIDLKDGRFSLKLDANAALAADGSLAASLAVSDLDYRDGQAEHALFRLDSAKASLSRVDIPGGIIAVDELSVNGAEAYAKRDMGGTLHAFGVAISTAPSTPPATQPAVKVAVPATAPATQPVIVLQTPSTQPAAPLVITRKKYPLVKVKKLDLNLSKFEFVDESRPKAAPIDVTKLRFFAKKPIEVLGDDPSARSAADLSLTLSIDRVIDSIAVNTQLAPFSQQPTVNIDVSATGIRGDGLLAIAPELADSIDAHELTDGRFKMHGETQMKIDRLDPLDFAMERGFDADFMLRNIEYRASDGGPVLAGVEEVRSEGIRVTPKNGNVKVGVLEVNNIVGQAALDKDGVHAMGLIVKMATTQPTTQPSAVAAAPASKPAPAVKGQAIAKAKDAPPAKSPAAKTTVAPSAPPAEPTGEIRIDKISVAGIDFRAEDRRVSPPLVVPINQLDLDIRGLSSLALTQNRPIKYDLLVGAGKVSLPQRQKKSLAGAVKDVGALIGGKKEVPATAPVMEQRDLFSQVQSNGEISLYPEIRGKAKAIVSGFDLAALKSEAKEFGVTLNNGVFDTNIDLAFAGDGSMTVKSLHSMTDMELKESPNGPIMRFINIPGMDLDTAVKLVTDADGSIGIPANISLDKGKLSSAGIAGAAANVIAAVLTKAALAAPSKGLNAAGDVAGAVTAVIPGDVAKAVPIPFLGGQAPPKKEEPLVLHFAAGDDALSGADRAALAALVQRMQKDAAVSVSFTHTLGGGDVERATARANPTPAECRELIDRLTRRRDELLRLRAEWSGRSREELASRLPADSAIAIERFHTIERELASTEDGLDKLYEMLRPGADRQAPRRTRQAALDLAKSRLDSVRSVFAVGQISPMEDRVHVARAQYNPGEDDAGGQVEIVITVKKK